MEKGDFNPSLSLDTLFPTLSDESFLQFLKDYYKFLQSTKLTLTDVSGTFVKDEVITGVDSKATGIISSVGTNEIIVIMSTQLPLDSREVITGSISSATATIARVKDNVLRESARLRDSRSQYVSGDEFFQLLKDEINRGYPSTSQADRRLLYNRIRDLLQSKSTEEAYRFLFKAFFDENIEIRFPGDDLLRVSDGKFEKTSLIRVIPTNTNIFPIGGIFDFLNKTIRGQTSGAVGTVVNIQTTFLGGIQYAEFNLKLVSGEFEAGETIADVLQPRLSTEIFGIIGDIQINDGGSGYSVGDAITITGDGAEASAEISSISTGPINRIIVNTPGYGYQLNTKAVVDNTDTAGDGLGVTVTSIANTYTVTDGTNNYIVGDTNRIQIVSRGSGYQRTPTITLVDSTIQSLGLLSERLITIANSGTNYVVGEILTFTGGSGSNAAGEVASVGNTEPYGEENILFEDDFVLLQEQEVNGLKSTIKSEDWGNLGSILRIELTNLGSGYTSANLPVLTLESANTVSGTNASFTVDGIQGSSANVAVDIANNAVGIGSIRQIDIRNPGINFSSANVDASAVGDGNANLEAIISGLNVNRGFFTNDDGKVNFKIIQDSFFYQDFSYVIRSGLIIDAYKELVKETVHPAGLEFFGEIVITSLIALRAEFRSQIDQNPRPLAISSFISLFPVGVNFPFTGAIREVEITPVVDQSISPRTSKFLRPSGASDDKNLSIREIAFERGISVPAEFSTEYIEKIHLFIDVALFPTFSDVQTGTIPTIPVELDYVLAGMSGVIDTHREYQIEIAPIRMEQPLAVGNFNIREIEIVKNIDAAVNIDDVKTQTTFAIADQYGETPLSFFAESLISSLSANTLLDFTGFETSVTRFFRRIDTQGLEVDLELVSTDLKVQVVDSTSFGTEQEVPLFVSVPLIDIQVAELVNRLELYIDASSQVVFNDVQVVETSISDIVLRIESGVTKILQFADVQIAIFAQEQIQKYSTNLLNEFPEFLRFNALNTDREYRIHLTPERLDQTVSVKGFNVRDIEIVKDIDATSKHNKEIPLNYFQFADIPIITFVDEQIQTYSSNALNENPGITFTKQVPRTVYDIDIFTKAVTSDYYKDQLLELFSATQISELSGISFNGLFVTPLASLGFKSTEYTLRIEPPLVTLAANLQPFRIFIDRLRLPSLGLGISIIDASINFDGTSYEIEMRPEFVQFAPTPIPQTTGRLKRLTYIVPPVVATINNIYEVIKIQKEIDVAPIPRMKLEIDVPPELATPFKEQFKDIQIATLANETIISNVSTEDYSNKTFLDTAYRYQSLSRVDIDYRVEIYPYLDSRMRFYSEILTMTNREMTVEIDVFSGPVDLSTKHGRSIAINYFQWADVPLLDFGNEIIATYSANSFNESPGISFTKEIPSTFYEIDIEPIRSQVVSLFIPTVEHLGNTERQIELYIDSRMRFYSEILTMTNREMTVEIDVFSFTNTSSITPQQVIINYVIAPTVIDVGVADFNIREIEITPATMDLRMAFYTEIYTMTNRVHTTEIEIQSGTNVASVFRPKLEIDIPLYPRTVIGEEIIEVYAEELIQNYELNTFNDSVNRNAVRLNTASEVIKYLELAVVDLRMAFYSEIYTMTNRIHTTEIEIQSGPVNVAASTLRIVTFNIPTYGEASIQLFASNTIAEFNNVTSDSNEFEADSTTITADESSIAFNTPLNISGTRQVPSSFYEIDILPSKDVASAFVAIEDRLVGMEKDVVLYIDMRMAFYSEILAMTNRVHTTEIDIFSFTNLASVTPQQIILNYVIAPVAINIEVQSLNREIVTQIALEQQVLTTIDSRPINRIIESEFTAEVVGAQQSTLSSLNRVDVRLGNETFDDLDLEIFKNTQISLYENQTFADKVAYGKSNFIEKFFTFDELQIRSFTDDLIEDFENDEIDNTFINKNVQKNIFINGTVSFTDPGFSAIRIEKLAGEEINTYSANNLLDLTGSNTSVFGTNTEFTADFLVGEELITSTEKFLVTRVANNTHLEVNVNPEENYNDVSVYREYFV